MFLKTLIIKNFRCIKDLEVNFSKGLNILIGENNSGKSSILDALRLALNYGNQQRDIYVTQDDFYIEKSNPDSEISDIEFNLTFEIENSEEAGIFNELHVVDAQDGSETLKLNFKYYIYTKNNQSRVRYSVWGGENEGQKITPDVLDLFYVVYLDALRDAARNLRPIRGNRLGQLYSSIETNETKQNELSSKVHKAVNSDPEWTDLIQNGETRVNEHLEGTSISGKEQEITIDFLPFGFQRIVDNLTIQLPIFSQKSINGDESKQKFFDLQQNGLGYNNLIFAATVLGDLRKKKEEVPEKYISLLIEEPEAHLHPQLQNTFFDYLSNFDQDHFQLFVSSHSPTITAKSNLNTINVLHTFDEKIYLFSLVKSKLDDNDKKYLHKFLDVTKSQLFFSNGVIIVEGISEALLLPSFSSIIGNEYNLSKNGVELINANGVAFKPFANIFNPEDPNSRLNIRCSILTDNDRKDGDISPRALNAQNLESGLLKVKLAEITFEYELFIAGNNRELLLEIFTEMHPISAGRIEEGNSLHDHAISFLEKIKSTKSKSEFAHNLALRLDSDNNAKEGFTIPDYIAEAIKWVISGV